MPFLISTLSAWISEDEKGKEGVCACCLGGQWLPMIAADETRVRELQPYAEALARASGHPVRLVRFELRGTIGTLFPDGRWKEGRNA